MGVRQEVAARVFARDEFTCRTCGTATPLFVHDAVILDRMAETVSDLAGYVGKHRRPLPMLWQCLVCRAAHSLFVQSCPNDGAPSPIRAPQSGEYSRHLRMVALARMGAIRRLPGTATIIEPDFSDFDRYCEEHGIKPGEEPTAFAAWLNGGTGWDGRMEKVESEPDDHDRSRRRSAKQATQDRRVPKHHRCGRHRRQRVGHRSG